MLTTPATQTTLSAAELWVVIKKEITGIELLLETVNGLYFQQQGKEWQALRDDTPLLIHLMQTALIESLFIPNFPLERSRRSIGRKSCRQIKRGSLIPQALHPSSFLHRKR